MKNAPLTRTETTLFLVTLLVPMTIEAVLAITAFPRLQWLLPTSLLFPAGLLAGIAMRSQASAPAARGDGEILEAA